jgi:arylsulfate sulfotransferase
MRASNLPLVGAAIVLTICSLGCGSGSGSTSGTPQTAISQTQNPLVAQYQVSNYRPANVWVEFGTDTTYGRKTSAVTETNQFLNNATILVAGMKANTTYHMRSHLDYIVGGSSWVSPDQTFTTGFLPSGNKLSFSVTRPNTGLNVHQSGIELLDLNAPGTANLSGAVADLDGNIIWFYPANPSGFAFPIKPLPDGNMLLSFDGLYEVDLAGNTVRSLTVGALAQRVREAGFSFNLQHLHHDILILPNGHWIVLGQITQTFDNLPGYPGDRDVEGDVLIDLDQNWNPVWAWNSFDHLDVNRHLMGLPDWTHANAVIYSPTDGNIILSMRNQSWITKIDYENGSGSGDILWRLGEGGDFVLPGNDDSQWFYAQHFPYLISEDGSQLQLAVFDDGNLRIPDGGGTGCLGIYPSCYTRAVIMNVDEATMLASVAWQYLPDLYTPWGGSIITMPNGDVEFDVTNPFGLTAGSRVLEVTGGGNSQVVWQMDILGSDAYRAYRIPSLYPGVTWTK